MIKKILCCMIALALVTSSVLATTSYAWASYDGLANIKGATPLHEDMTQFAYAHLMKTKYLSPAPTNQAEMFSGDAVQMLPPDTAAASPDAAASVSSADSADASTASSEAPMSSPASSTASSTVSSPASSTVSSNASVASSDAPVSAASPESESISENVASDTAVSAAQAQSAVTQPAAPASGETAAVMPLSALNTPEIADPVADPAVVKNLLYASNAEEYEENLYFLRMGAYWNDVAANNAAEFILGYYSADWITAYTHNDGKTYGNAYNVGRHLKDTEDDDWIPYRTMVKFSFNERANFIHSMLGVDADESYMSQKAMQEFQWQWLEVVYRYARDGSNAGFTEDQKALLSLIDPYGQLTTDYRDARVGSFTPADDHMTEEQMRLRALGSMCHTLEDSFNPAHTIRSYYDADGSNQFGTILAFGNYVVQGSENHMPWDAPSVADANVRKELADNTTDLNKLQAYSGNVSDKMKTTRTLGLNLAWNAAYKLLDLYADGADWDTVKAWLETEVLKTSFNADGGSVVWDAGRRAGNMSYIEGTASSMAQILKICFPKSETLKALLNTFTSECGKFAGYHAKLLNFFQATNTSPESPIYHSDFEAEGQTAVKQALKSLHDVFSALTPDERTQLLRKMDHNTIGRWKKMVNALNGIAQEFSLDLRGEQDADANLHAKSILDLLSKKVVTGCTGIVTAHDTEDMAYWLRTVTPDAMETVTRVTYSADLPPLEVGQTANVSFDETQLLVAGQPSDYHATAIVAEDQAQTHTAKGILKSLTDASITLTSDEGGADYVLKLAPGVAVAQDLTGKHISVVYTAADGKPLTVQNVREVTDPALHALPEATVVALYGGQMRVCTNEWKETIDTAQPTSQPPQEYDVIYSDADLIGTPVVGALVKVFYPDWAALVDPASPDALIMASRIVSDNHQHAFHYQTDNNGTHQKLCTALDAATTENCTPDTNGQCTLCGAKSHIELTRGGIKSEILWNSAALQAALATAQDGDVFQFIPLFGVNTLALGSDALSVRANVTVQLGGSTLSYTGREAAFSSSATALKLDNGTVSSENTALSHTASSAKTLLNGITLHAKNGYTVTGGGTVALSGTQAERVPSYLTGGGVDKQSKPVVIDLTGRLLAGQLLLALPQNPALPMPIVSSSSSAFSAEDLGKIGYGTKNAYHGDGVFAIIDQDIQLLPKISLPSAQKTTVNGGGAENSSFTIGTALEFTAYRYQAFTPVGWSINPTGQFTQVNTTGSYTSGKVQTDGFAPGAHTLTIVHRDTNGKLAAEAYTVNFKKPESASSNGGENGGGNGGGDTGGTVIASSSSARQPKSTSRKPASAVASKSQEASSKSSSSASQEAASATSKSQASQSQSVSASDIPALNPAPIAGKPFVPLNVLLAIWAVAVAVIGFVKQKRGKQKFVAAVAAVGAVAIMAFTLSGDGLALANIWTLPTAMLSAAASFFALRQTTRRNF